MKLGWVLAVTLENKVIHNLTSSSFKSWKILVTKRCGCQKYSDFQKYVFQKIQVPENYRTWKNYRSQKSLTWKLQVLKNLDPENIESQRLMSPKNISSHKKIWVMKTPWFCPKKCGSQKIWVLKNSGSKKFGSQKLLGPKRLGSRAILGHDKIFCPEKFWSQKI